MARGVDNGEIRDPISAAKEKELDEKAAREHMAGVVDNDKELIETAA
jgi:hypothetical protein